MKHENFIRTYSDVLSDNCVYQLQDIANNQDNLNVNTERGLYKNSYISYKRNSPYKKDKQIVIEPFWPDLANYINLQLVEKCLKSYINDFSFLKSFQDWDWVSGTVLLQKTKPTEGYHAFHCENTSWNNMNRCLAWMIYLNDVEEGGETEFLYQSLRVKPKKNTAVIWPGSFTHLHRGNPPLNQDKYIITGWFQSMYNMPTFSLRDA
tara:strand:+ start:54 stop:674 length:621 start_codon:yes stop_codon:yes gene_type:complete